MDADKDLLIPQSTMIAYGARIEALRAALTTYGKHGESCPATFAPGAVCNCGYAEAVKMAYSEVTSSAEPP